MEDDKYVYQPSPAEEKLAEIIVASGNKLYIKDLFEKIEEGRKLLAKETFEKFGKKARAVKNCPKCDSNRNTIIYVANRGTWYVYCYNCSHSTPNCVTRDMACLCWNITPSMIQKSSVEAYISIMQDYVGNKSQRCDFVTGYDDLFKPNDHRLLVENLIFKSVEDETKK
jgi:hypothetical protein